MQTLGDRLLTVCDRPFISQEVKMQIETIQASFLISIGNCSNERIGFSVRLEEGEKIEEVVTALRERAVQIVGRPAKELYEEKWRLESEIRILTRKIQSLQEEWNRTADFLVAQGINPDAPRLTPVSGLLSAAKVEEESILTGEITEEEGQIS